MTRVTRRAICNRGCKRVCPGQSGLTKVKARDRALAELAWQATSKDSPDRYMTQAEFGRAVGSDQAHKRVPKRAKAARARVAERGRRYEEYDQGHNPSQGEETQA